MFRVSRSLPPNWAFVLNSAKAACRLEASKKTFIHDNIRSSNVKCGYKSLPIGQLKTRNPNYILLKEYIRLDYLFESGCGYFNICILRKQKSQGYQKVGISKLFNIPGTECLMSNSQQNVCSQNNSKI